MLAENDESSISLNCTCVAGGSSNLPCDDTFMGGSAFSEVEVKAMSDYYNTIANRAVFFLSIHSYSQLILLPYGYSNERYEDYQEYVCNHEIIYEII